MKSFDQLQQETNVLQIDFLLTDLTTALTFVDIAQTTSNCETRARNLGNASLAYKTLMHFLPRVTMTEEQSTELHSKMALLKERIDALQCVVTQDPEAALE